VSWREQLEASGFDSERPAVVVSTGVSMYLTKEANAATLREIAGFAAGSTLAMTYLLPMDMADTEERPAREFAERGARASGTPFISFFRPEEIVALARAVGFTQARHVSAADLDQRYFAGRTDGLRLSRSEEMLVATT
jgi:O-methyltransferase involved in polyketide biosynthesis